MVWGMASFFGAWLRGPLRRAAARRLRNPLVDDTETMRLAFYGARHHRSRLLRPEPLTDAQLASISASTRIVVGGRSEVFPHRAVCERARLIPNASVEVVVGAGHALAFSHLEETTRDLGQFLASVSPGSR
jgi:pimeloyl-ACP methyl ester carboxylesterase